MRYFIELSYDGTAYHGWQSQPNAVTVQDTVEKALSLLLRYPTKITAAGRTDAGVHARQMFAHFDSYKELDSNGLTYKLNAFLPHDIAVKAIREVKVDAHARFDAIGRSYTYLIHNRKDPFLHPYSWFYKQELDVSAMNKAAKALLFFEDFKSFSKTHTDVKTFICHISEAYWEQKDHQLLFHISADRFLRNMVRAIVGTLVNVGLHKLTITDFTKVIESRDRSKAGFSVPAQGLYLTEIQYPSETFI